MINITKFGGVNFGSFYAFDIDVQPGTLTLVLGNNLKDEGMESNASGKSTLFAPLSWAPFGLTPRGLSGADAVNDDNRKPGCALLMIEYGANKYQINRYARDKEHGASPVIHRNGRPYSPKGKEIRDVIFSIFPMNFTALSACYLFGPADDKNAFRLTTMTDKESKQVMDYVMGTHTFQDIQENAKKGSRFYTGQAEVCDSELSKLESNFGILFEKAEEVKKRLGEAEEKLGESSTDKKAGDTKLTSLRDSIGDLQANKETVKAKIAKLDKKIELVNRTVRDINSELDILASKKVDVANEIASLEGLVGEYSGGLCPLCHSEVNRGTIRSILRDKRKDLVEIEGKIEVLASDKARNQNLLDSFDEEGSGLLTERRDLEKKLEEKNILLARAEEQDKSAKEQRDLLGRQREKVAEEYERAREECESVKGKIARLKTKSSRSGMLRDHYDYLERSFGGAGIRSFMLDTYAPLLTEMTSGFLKEIVSGLDIVFQTRRETYGGKRVSDDFTILINNGLGWKKFERFCGGEKRRIDMAVMRGHRKLWEACTGNSLNVVCYDEVLGPLDDIGSRRVLDSCRREAREDKRAVFVIANNNFEQAIDTWGKEFDRILLVEKDESGSRVSEV